MNKNISLLSLSLLVLSITSCDNNSSQENTSSAEYYTGTAPDSNKKFYIDQDLFYFPELESSGFKKVNYDGETEYAYYYTDGTNNDYIFATLPALSQGNESLPTDMMHSEEEASQNKVLHIKEAGTYVLSGTWNGQINVDLGEDAFTDETQKVTLILNGVDINCSVASGIIFTNVYECDNTWEDKTTHSQDVDITNTGANVIIGDGSVNKVNGNNVYRMLKTKYKDETTTMGVKTQKKAHKVDAAFYSYMSMNVNGGVNNDGVLQITSSFEGLDSELHLGLNGGNIQINSQDDGINVNEDNVSICFINGGNITINAALGAEGDGIDSNGFIVLNGGVLNINNVVTPDNALDSEDGVYYNGGDLYISGTKKELTKGQKYSEVSGGDNRMFGPGGQGGQNQPGGQGGTGGQNPPGGFGGR